MAIRISNKDKIIEWIYDNCEIYVENGELVLVEDEDEIPVNDIHHGDLIEPETIISETGEFGSVNTDLLNSPPTGVLAQLDGDQDIAHDSLTKVNWESETVRGEVDSLLDSDNNAVIVPDGFDYAKVSFSWRFVGAGGAEIDWARVLFDGSTKPAGAVLYSSPGLGLGRFGISTDWVSINPGEEITAHIRQVHGDTRTLEERNLTYMGVTFR